MDPYRFRGYVHHRDHRITGMVAMDAVFPYARDRLHYPEQLAEGLQPHKVGELYFSGSEEPNTFVDISEVFDQKVTALRCHRSQIGDVPEELFRERIRAMASTWGEAAGFPLAEAFRRVQLRM
jgi:LmbE family N-acetylglucosaminyl deacetylase